MAENTVAYDGLTPKAELLLKDLIGVADENGILYSTTLEKLQIFTTSLSDIAFKGGLAIADTPTEDGWYFAGESGTYTNAGGLVVDIESNLVIIIVSNTQTSFSKVDIPLSITLATPSDPLEGSTKFSDDGQMYDKINVLTSKQDTCTYISGVIDTSVGVGNVVDLTVISNSNARHGIIDCVEGDEFYLRGIGGSTPRLWAFLNADNEIITVASAYAATWLTPDTVVAPANSVKAIFNVFINIYPDCYVKKIESIFKDIYTVKEELEEVLQEVLQEQIDDIDKILTKEVSVNAIEDSYISRTTKLLVQNSEYKYVEPIDVSTLSGDLFVSIGNQGGSVSQIHWLSGNVINEANFVSSQIEGVGGNGKQLIKVRLIKPNTATHVAFSSLAIYDIKLYKTITDEEFAESLKRTFTNIYKNSLLSNSLGINPFNEESMFLQKRASNLISFEDDGNVFFYNFGQSNTDRRVPYADAPQWFKDLNGKIDNYMIWNRNTKVFQSYESGVCTGADNIDDTRWGYDIIFAKAYLDANPNKKIYSFSRSVGGTPIFEDPQGTSCWQPKTELVPIGKVALCSEVVTELKEMIVYCSDNNIKLNAQFIAMSQGESDADLGQIAVDAFLQNRKNLISFFRGLIITPNLPVINLELKETISNPLYADINSDLATISTEDSNHFVIQGMQSYNVLNDGYNAHWDGDAMIYAGGKIYDRFLALNPTY